MLYPDSFHVEGNFLEGTKQHYLCPKPDLDQ